MNDISKLLLSIDDQNFNDIIHNLREIRKNLSIDNSIYALTNFTNIEFDDIENFKNFFTKIGDKFLLILTQPYKDIYEIKFDFKTDEHEIIEGQNIKDYEGIPVKIDEFKKNAVYINDDEEKQSDHRVYGHVYEAFRTFCRNRKRWRCCKNDGDGSGFFR